MKNYYVIIFAIVALLVGCYQPQQLINPNYDGIFAHQKPVDLTPVLEVYEWAAGAEDSIDFAEFIVKLIPECKRYLNDSIYDEELESNWFINLTDTIRLGIGHLMCNDELIDMQKEDLLLNTEQLYNSSMLMKNMGSLYEVWLRNELLLEDARNFDSEQVVEAIRNLNVDILTEPKLECAIQNCRDSVLYYMNMGLYAWDDNPYPVILMEEKEDLILERYRKNYEAFTAGIEVTDTSVTYETDTIMAGERFRRYKDATDDDQLGVMLKELAACKDFDEQCALWRLWADCKESMEEDDWIIAVAMLLMDSGEYNPLMNIIWLTWRALFQGQNCGMSKDSIIPNDFYNEYRKKCFAACIRHLIRHPEDGFCMERAMVLSLLPNLNRMLGWAGNNALYEMAMLMPERFEGAFDD